MRIRIANENADAARLIPPTEPDGSGIGVNYVDAYIKVFNTELDDGRKVTCKRRGLKLMLTVDDAQGEALLRRIDDGPDVKHILRKALSAAAEAAGFRVLFEDHQVWLETAD